MKTILVPTDFSESAKHALHYACRIAVKSESRIVLLHVISTPEYKTAPFQLTGSWSGDKSAGSEVPFMMKLMESTRKKMKALIATLKSKKISITDVIESGGEISAMINKAAARYKASLIVMGTRGATGLNEIFVGSTAEQVGRDAEVPVLSINDGKQKIDLKNILFATDFSDETLHVWPYLQSFAGLFGATVHCLKIVTDGDAGAWKKEQKRAEEFMEDTGMGKHHVHILHHLSSKEEGIRRFAESIDADLIALGTHGRHGLARFFKGSIAGGLVNHSHLPVLTVNFHKKMEAARISLLAEQKMEKKKKPQTPIPYIGWPSL